MNPQGVPADLPEDAANALMRRFDEFARDVLGEPSWLEPLGRDLDVVPISTVCDDCREERGHCLSDPFCGCPCVEGED